jgi:uncharacterized protein
MLIRLLILIILFIVVYRAIKSWLRRLSEPQERSAAPPSMKADDVMIQDPECGIYLARRDAVTFSENGKTYYFCSQSCKNSYMDKKKR